MFKNTIFFNNVFEVSMSAYTILCCWYNRIIKYYF